MNTDLIFAAGMITGVTILTISALFTSYLERKRK